MNKAKGFIVGATVVFLLVAIRDGNTPAMITSAIILALVGGGE